MTDMRAAAADLIVAADRGDGVVLAVDIGGTKLAAALVGSGGPGEVAVRPTPAGDAEAALLGAAALVRDPELV